MAEKDDSSKKIKYSYGTQNDEDNIKEKINNQGTKTGEKNNTPYKSKDDSSKKIKYSYGAQNDEDNIKEKINNQGTKTVEKNNTPYKSKGDISKKVKSKSITMAEDNTLSYDEDDSPEKVNFEGEKIVDTHQVNVLKSLKNEFDQLEEMAVAMDAVTAAHVTPESAAEIEDKEGMFKFEVAKCFYHGLVTDATEKEMMIEKKVQKQKKTMNNK